MKEMSKQGTGQRNRSIKEIQDDIKEINIRLEKAFTVHLTKATSHNKNLPAEIQNLQKKRYHYERMV